MFSYLRYFAIIGFVLVVVGALSLSFYFRQIKQAEILELSSKQTAASLDSYSSAIWNRYANELLTNPNSPYMPSFAYETKNYFQNQPIDKVTIFSIDQKIRYFVSSTISPKGEDEMPIQPFAAERPTIGHPLVAITKSVHFADSTEPAKERMVLHVVTAVARVDGKVPEAYAEAFVDVSAQWSKLQLLQYLILGTMIGTYVVLVTVLIFTAGRAEAIITKQHEINLELTAAAAQAEAQSRDKSQFLASVSHELRTPLNAIIGFSEIIKNEAQEKLEKIYQDYLEDIYASGKHLLSLINDILDYSKAEAGKLQVEWGETDATKVIRNSLRMVLPRAEAAQVTLVEEIPSQHLVIVTDAKKLKQVLLNLLSNAVKFTRAGGEVRCHAWMDVVTGAMMIQVKDTGIGIAPKDISRVMTPFGQVDSALSRKYEGTGLGLPLSKKFIESMGGTFTIESELNVGTSVTLALPKAPPYWGTQNQQQTAEEGHVPSTTADHEGAA